MISRLNRFTFVMALLLSVIRLRLMLLVHSQGLGTGGRMLLTQQACTAVMLSAYKDRSLSQWKIALLFSQLALTSIIPLLEALCYSFFNFPLPFGSFLDWWCGKYELSTIIREFIRPRQKFIEVIIWRTFTEFRKLCKQVREVSENIKILHHLSAFLIFLILSLPFHKPYFSFGFSYLIRLFCSIPVLWFS